MIFTAPMSLMSQRIGDDCLHSLLYPSVNLHAMTMRRVDAPPGNKQKEVNSVIKCLCAAILILANPVQAEGITDNLAVNQVRVDQNGRGYITFIGDLTGTPASCTTSTYTKMLAFDTNTAGGRAIMALALTAKAVGSTIYARGPLVV